jgi:hypothetical protein
LALGSWAAIRAWPSSLKRLRKSSKRKATPDAIVWAVSPQKKRSFRCAHCLRFRKRQCLSTFTI